jgi:hypothetical protein
VQAELQALEGAVHNDELAIEYEVVLGDLLDAAGDLRKVSLERLLVLRLQVDAAAAPMREAAEAVVLRLVLPPRSHGELVDGLRLHWRQIERQLGLRSTHGSPAVQSLQAAASPESSFSPRSTRRSEPSGNGRCKALASSHGASSQVSHSPGFVRITGIALGWTAATSALGAEVRNPKRSALTARPACEDRLNLAARGPSVAFKVFTKPEPSACTESLARRPSLRSGGNVMLSRLWWLARAHLETFRQYRSAAVTAEALIWHHGYKGLDAALKTAENPTGDLREDVRCQLVAKLAADRYLCFKHAGVFERAAMLDVWSRRRGQMIRVGGAPLADAVPAHAWEGPIGAARSTGN